MGERAIESQCAGLKQEELLKRRNQEKKAFRKEKDRNSKCHRVIREGSGDKTFCVIIMTIFAIKSVMNFTKRYFWC